MKSSPPPTPPRKHGGQLGTEPPGRGREELRAGGGGEQTQGRAIRLPVLPGEAREPGSFPGRGECGSSETARREEAGSRTSEGHARSLEEGFSSDPGGRETGLELQQQRSQWAQTQPPRAGRRGRAQEAQRSKEAAGRGDPAGGVERLTGPGTGQGVGLYRTRGCEGSGCLQVTSLDLKWTVVSRPRRGQHGGKESTPLSVSDM